MQTYDIRQNIMSSMTQNVNELRYQCNIDQMSRQICSTRSFWIQIFNNQGLKLPKIKLYTPEQWLIEYEKELLIQHKINILLRILVNPQPGDFDNNDHYFDETQLYVVANEFPFNLLPLDDIDSKIYTYWNRYLLLKSTARGDYLNYPQIQFMINNNIYTIIFEFQTNTDDMDLYPYQLSYQSFVDLLHLVLDSNANFINVNGNKVLYK
jgi:hypothetical protein